jgi:hypothetical protein
MSAAHTATTKYWCPECTHATSWAVFQPAVDLRCPGCDAAMQIHPTVLRECAPGAWLPSDGYIAGPEEQVDDDEGGIDIALGAKATLAIEFDELSFDVDLATALAAWQPDDWHAVHSRPVGDRAHTFMFSHSTLAPLVAQPDAALIAKCLDDSGVMLLDC